MPMDCEHQSIFCKNQMAILPLYFNGEVWENFLKKLEKWATSSKPKLNAISEMFQSVLLSKILASSKMRAWMMAVVVLPVVSLSTLFRWLAWTANRSAKSLGVLSNSCCDGVLMGN